jgi:hypothetical protein
VKTAGAALIAPGLFGLILGGLIRISDRGPQADSTNRVLAARAKAGRRMSPVLLMGGLALFAVGLALLAASAVVS